MVPIILPRAGLVSHLMSHRGKQTQKCTVTQWIGTGKCATSGSLNAREFLIRSFRCAHLARLGVYLPCMGAL